MNDPNPNRSQSTVPLIPNNESTVTNTQKITCCLEFYGANSLTSVIKIPPKSEPYQIPTLIMLPLDVIMDVLSRLPVKSLLRFRCVSKTFCSLIDGKDFVNMHLNRSIQTKSNLSLILSVFVWQQDSRIYSLSLDSLDGNSVEVAQPFRNLMCKVVGSCNGLLALQPFQTRQAGLVLINPSTQKHRVVSMFCSDLNGSKNYFNGFGYDVCSDDYKLARIVMVRKSLQYTEVEVGVYSLRNNSWRKIKDFPYHFWKHGGNGVFVSGALHWVANLNPEARKDDLIIAFDLKTEEFYQVPTPLAVGNEGSLSVKVLSGFLSLVCVYGHHGPYEIWVMKDYGVKDSWTKLFSFQEGVMGPGVDVKPLAYSRSGDKVLVGKNSADLYWYDTEGQRVESTVEINRPVQGFYDNAMICVDSLVSLDAYTWN